MVVLRGTEPWWGRCGGVGPEWAGRRELKPGARLDGTSRQLAIAPFVQYFLPDNANNFPKKALSSSIPARHAMPLRADAKSRAVSRRHKYRPRSLFSFFHYVLPFALFAP
jgi:hypothetical protein